MDRKEIEEQVKEILADRLDIDKEKIKLDSDLVNDLGMDSFGTIEVVFELEDKFNIAIPEDDLAGVAKVNDIVNYLALKKNEQN